MRFCFFTAIPGLGKSGSDFNSSRPNSPPSSNHSIQSLKSGNNNGLRQPSIKSGIPAPGSNNISTIPTVNGQQKHSMLDKLKLFNKEKQQLQPPQAQQQTTLTNSNKNQLQSKRTSSSSGFSSARSERSDSSLSLNDGHISQIKPPTVSLTSANKTRDTKANNKQSKLLQAQSKKDLVKNVSKNDKKEKSPARSLNKEDAAMESKTSTLSRSKNSLPRGKESSSKPSTKSNLTNKSESKTSLIIPPSKALNSPNAIGGLPKPIAAIKGTSKLPQSPLQADNKSRMTNSNSSQDMMKREKSDISSNMANVAHAQNISPPQQNPSNHQHQPPTHIVKPVPMMPEPQTHNQKSPYYANAQSMQQGMLQQQAQQQQQIMPQPIQEPTYSRLPPPKPSTVGTPTSVRKLEYNSGPGVLQPQQHSPLRSLTPASYHSQPVTPTSQQTPLTNGGSPNKYHTIPSKIVGTIYEEDKPVNVMPMRPLLRGYNSHVTLPTRGARGTHNFISEYCENDINQGYCSDGDSLRFSNSRLGHGSSLQGSPRFQDIDNGYLSEGSSGIGLNHNGHHPSHGKHFLSMMRARSQLPTTIEER